MMFHFQWIMQSARLHFGSIWIQTIAIIEFKFDTVTIKGEKINYFQHLWPSIFNYIYLLICKSLCVFLFNWTDILLCHLYVLSCWYIHLQVVFIIIKLVLLNLLSLNVSKKDSLIKQFKKWYYFFSLTKKNVVIKKWREENVLFVWHFFCVCVCVLLFSFIFLSFFFLNLIINGYILFLITPCEFDFLEILVSSHSTSINFT